MRRLGMRRVGLERLTLTDWRMRVTYEKGAAPDFFREVQASKLQCKPNKESLLGGLLQLSRKRKPTPTSAATLDLKFQATADEVVSDMQRLGLERLALTERRMVLGQKDALAEVLPRPFITPPKEEPVEETTPTPQRLGSQSPPTPLPVVLDGETRLEADQRAERPPRAGKTEKKVRPEPRRWGQATITEQARRVRDVRAAAARDERARAQLFRKQKETPRAEQTPDCPAAGRQGQRRRQRGGCHAQRR